MHQPDPPGTPGIGMRINLLCQIAVGILAMAVSLASMPDWIEIFDSTQERVQLTLAAYLLMFGLAQLIYGPLSDNFGRRRLLIVGSAMGLVGSLMAAFAPTLEALIIARALQGAGMSAGMAVGRAMIQDHFVGSARTRMMAYMGMVMGLCPPGGTLLGGFLHVHVGWRYAFIAVALISFALLLAAWLGLPGDKPKPKAQMRSATGMVRSYLELVRSPRYLPYCLIAAFSSAAFYVFLAGTPNILDAYGVSADQIGWYILFVPGSYVLGNLLTTRLVQRYNDAQLMWTGQIITFVGVFGVVALAYSGVYHPLAISIPLALLGVGHGLLMPPAVGGAVGAVPALAGAGAAMAGMLQQITGALGSVTTGYLDLSNALGMGLLMLLLTILAILAQLAMASQTPKVVNSHT
jgi:DHA1 family bicyclomycin/chloramphenicol resistance-like MFS transporter